MRWIKYTIETTTAAEDLVSAALADLGIEGVQIENLVPLTEADTAKMFIDILPELPEDDGSSRVSFYLDADEDHTALLLALEESLDELRPFVDVGSGAVTQSETEDVDWVNNWKEFFHSFTIEGEAGCRPVRIKPTWEERQESEQEEILIEIDPGISFGTGQHETTQLCIRELMKFVKDGSAVLDLGCGSGILSIVSLKLGAGHVTGTDIDEECLNSTRSNFAVNALSEECGDFLLGDVTGDAALRERLGKEKYDIVVANILADVIIPMAAVIPDFLKPGGVFIASGIIDFKEEDVIKAIEKAGLSVCEVTHQGEWVGITARKESC